MKIRSVKIPVEIIGGVHRAPDVEVQPDVTLVSWRIFEVSSEQWEGRTRHFCGYLLNDREGRCSTPIVEFDKNTMIGKTQSGRIYHLKGKSGHNMDALYVWSTFFKINGMFDGLDISNEYDS